MRLALGIRLMVPFLAEWLKTRDAFAAAHFANAAAALSTQGYGAVAPIPRRAAVEAFMAN